MGPSARYVLPRPYTLEVVPEARVGDKREKDSSEWVPFVTDRHVHHPECANRRDCTDQYVERDEQRPAGHARCRNHPKHNGRHGKADNNPQQQSHDAITLSGSGTRIARLNWR